MSRRLNEVKTGLNSQIQDAITPAIASTVLPSIQKSLESREELILPWWTEGPQGHILARRRQILPWRTKGPVDYNGTPK